MNIYVLRIFDKRFKMPGNFKKEDLRVIKTRKVILNAMLVLLNRRDFAQITVNDLCDEALVSRTTFYAHFNDKYDLLKYWMVSIKREIIKDIYNYEDIKMRINKFIDDNTKVITNIVAHANSEVLELLHNFMYSIVELAVTKKADNGLQADQILLANFCAGGMVNVLVWQVKNDFPSNSKMINTYFYEILRCVIQWDAKQE